MFSVVASVECHGFGGHTDDGIAGKGTVSVLPGGQTVRLTVLFMPRALEGPLREQIAVEPLPDLPVKSTYAASNDSTASFVAQSVTGNVTLRGREPSHQPLIKTTRKHPKLLKPEWLKSTKGAYIINNFLHFGRWETTVCLRVALAEDPMPQRRARLRPGLWIRSCLDEFHGRALVGYLQSQGCDELFSLPSSFTEAFQSNRSS